MTTIDEMYPSESDLNKDIDKVKELIDKLASYKGKLAESKSNLYEALHTSEDAGRILEKLYVYTHMKSHEDTRINDNQGKATKIDMLSTELSMATSYMVPEIISIDEAKLNEYLQDEKLSFYKKYVEDEAKEGPKLPDEDAERQMYWDTETLMEKNGYHRYEISNYAKEGYACRHNLGYWERIPYLGFGIGAASLVPGELIGKCRKLEGKMGRYTNPDQLREYAHSYRNKFQAELLTETEEMEEFMFLGLRKMDGISKKEFSEYFGKSLEDIYGEAICKLESLKLLEQDDDRVWLTKRGIDVSNSVFVEFLLEG